MFCPNAPVYEHNMPTGSDSVQVRYPNAALSDCSQTPILLARVAPLSGRVKRVQNNCKRIARTRLRRACGFVFDRARPLVDGHISGVDRELAALLR
jgi:hypothetical protein